MKNSPLSNIGWSGYHIWHNIYSKILMKNHQWITKCNDNQRLLFLFDFLETILTKNIIHLKAKDYLNFLN